MILVKILQFILKTKSRVKCCFFYYNKVVVKFRGKALS